LVMMILTVPFVVRRPTEPDPEPDEEPETDPDLEAPDLETPPAIVPVPPEGYPTVASVPTERPQPRAKPQAFKFRELKRYEVTVDALPVTGVTLQQLADQIIPYLRMASPDYDTTAVIERAGHPATRVRFTASCLFAHSEALDRERSFAGVGSMWLVSARDLGPY